MTSEVTIKLVGRAIPTFTAIGASVTYGINRIPTATVTLDPSATPLLCDFDSIRRTDATLTIETTKGCLYFDGQVDGMSFSQSPGGLSATLQLKHKFQFLTEVYPRIVGIHPGSNDVFNPAKLIKLEYNGRSADGTSTADQLIQQLSVYDTNLAMDQNPIDFAVEFTKASLASQKVIPILAEDLTTVGLNRVLKDSELFRKGLIDQALQLLDTIDTSGTDGMIISAASPDMADYTLQTISQFRDNAFSSLVRLFSEFGCCLVIGSRGAYVVPEATYLRIPKAAGVGSQQRSRTPNVIYPAEYLDFSFNDSGFVNLRGVYVTHDSGTSLGTTTKSPNIDLGLFIDESAYGNIFVTTLPVFVSYGIAKAAVLNRRTQQKLKSKIPLFTRRVDTAEAKSEAKGPWESLMTSTRETYMNQWAQMEYCRLKFDDRTGSINSGFNNNWAPGMVGSLYTRSPGTYLDFFVTDVTHRFACNPPSSGSANTSINFKGGRMGTTAGAGLDSLALFDYDYEKALEFGSKFLKDIST